VESRVKIIDRIFKIQVNIVGNLAARSTINIKLGRAEAVGNLSFDRHIGYSTTLLKLQASAGRLLKIITAANDPPT